MLQQRPYRFHAPEMGARPRPRRVWSTRTIALPGPFLGWLGFEPTELARAMRTRGLKSFDHVERADHTVSVSVNAEDCPAELEESARYATCVQVDRLPSELTSETAETLDEWRRRLAHYYREATEAFRKRSPHAVVVVQGFEPRNAAARCAALHLGLPIVAIENTAMSDRMLWDVVSGITTNRNLARNVYHRVSAGLDPQSSERFAMETIRNTKRMKMQEHASPDGAAPKSDRPTLLYLGQVYTDSSLVFGLRRWSTPMEVMRHAARWCHEHGFHLVIKLHPKEQQGRNTVDGRRYDGLTYRRLQADKMAWAELQRVGAEIDFDNRYDTYQLIEDCRVAVTVNSQSGLEAAIRGKPVVVCGQAFYGDLDFTWDAPAPELFSAAMTGALSERGTDVSAARRFHDAFFRKYCRSKTVDGLIDLIEEGL